MTSNETQTGLLLAMMEPPPSFEEEFQDWYDTEHFPERSAIDGFLTAARFICLDGWPRYLALYDLTSVDVLHGGSYGRIAGANYTVWTNRVIPRVWGHYRAEGIQVYPGNAKFGGQGWASRIAVWRFRNVPASVEGALVEGLTSLYESRPETAQVRVFKAHQKSGTDYIGIVELHAPFVPAAGAVEAFGAARKHLDLVNCYTRYARS